MSNSKKNDQNSPIQTKNDGYKYLCDLCDYKARHRSNLLTHMKSKHEGVKYPCNYCDYRATQKGSLSSHVNSKHEGVEYPCNQCEYITYIKREFMGTCKISP